MAKDLDQLDADIARVQIRENEDIGFPRHFTWPFYFMLGHSRDNGGIQLEFAVALDVRALLVDQLYRFSDHIDSLVFSGTRCGEGQHGDSRFPSKQGHACISGCDRDACQLFRIRPCRNRAVRDAEHLAFRSVEAGDFGDAERRSGSNAFLHTDNAHRLNDHVARGAFLACRNAVNPARLQKKHRRAKIDGQLFHDDLFLAADIGDIFRSKSFLHFLVRVVEILKAFGTDTVFFCQSLNGLLISDKNRCADLLLHYARTALQNRKAVALRKCHSLGSKSGFVCHTLNKIAQCLFLLLRFQEMHFL